MKQNFVADDSANLMDHLESPFHKGWYPDATICLSSQNALCGDQIKLQVKLGIESVEEAWFEGNGCAVSQAAASMLCEHIHGKDIQDALATSSDWMLGALGVTISPFRKPCALLALRVLKQMLERHVIENRDI